VEFDQQVLEYLAEFPEQEIELLDRLAHHSHESVRESVPSIRKTLRKLKEQIKDIEQIRNTSSLRPGARMQLCGGYSQSDPWWLNGRKLYKATFIDFADRGAGKMPVAMVELEDEIDMTEARGLRHKGRYALLKLMFVADWVETETVTVHIVEALPKNLAEFYLAHPFGTEIESHATYVLSNKSEAGESASRESD
jgi:hypothetical protein